MISGAWWLGLKAALFITSPWFPVAMCGLSAGLMAANFILGSGANGSETAPMEVIKLGEVSDVSQTASVVEVVEPDEPIAPALKQLEESSRVTASNRYDLIDLRSKYIDRTGDMVTDVVQVSNTSYSIQGNLIELQKIRGNNVYDVKIPAHMVYDRSLWDIFDLLRVDPNLPDEPIFEKTTWEVIFEPGSAYHSVLYGGSTDVNLGTVGFVDGKIAVNYDVIVERNLSSTKYTAHAVSLISRGQDQFYLYSNVKTLYANFTHLNDAWAILYKQTLVHHDVMVDMYYNITGEKPAILGRYYGELVSTYSKEVAYLAHNTYTCDFPLDGILSKGYNSCDVLSSISKVNDGSLSVAQASCFLDMQEAAVVVNDLVLRDFYNALWTKYEKIWKMYEMLFLANKEFLYIHVEILKETQIANYYGLHAGVVEFNDYLFDLYGTPMNYVVPAKDIIIMAPVMGFDAQPFHAMVEQMYGVDGMFADEIPADETSDEYMSMDDTFGRFGL